MPKFTVSSRSNASIGSAIQFCENARLRVKVLSAKDRGQQLRFRASLRSLKGRTVANRDSHSADAWQTGLLPCGTYILDIEPKTGSSHHDFRHIPLGADFSQRVSLSGNSDTDVLVTVSRKESVLFDIHYYFDISSNAGADGGRPAYASDAMRHITEGVSFDQYYPFANDSADRFAVSLMLILAIAYTETTQGYYDEVLEWVGRNKSIRPMNINVDYWSKMFTAQQMQDVHQNFLAGGFLLRRIADRVRQPSLAKVATLYNGLGLEQVNDYGARVEAVHAHYSRKFLKHAN